MPQREPPPAISPALLAPCEAMPAAPDARYETLVRIHDAEMEVHYRCADRHLDLAKAAREMQATAWRWYCAAAGKAGFAVPECKTRK